MSPVKVSEQQHLVTLDLEGVLVPEIWVAIAERTGIPELRRTTRDEPDYDLLMRGRLDLLGRHGLTMSGISEVVGAIEPIEGARAFLDALRGITQVVILSDTFEQFGAPLMRRLGMPTLFCHRLVVEDDRITGYRLRMKDQKRHAVEAFRNLNFRVVAAGDSYNDAAMLAAADAGFWFRAPPHIRDEFRQYPSTDSYDELLSALTGALR
jgi:phosphoserine/homoserine phosphotransferase